MNKEHTNLIERLVHDTNVLGNKALRDAFTHFDRADFLPEDYKIESYEDYAVPIGHGEHLTKPSTLAFMIELLSVEHGDTVLDIGSGSGFSTAILSDLVGTKGKVTGVEIIPELIARSQEALEKYQIKNVEIFPAVSDIGFPKNGPYSRILVSSSVSTKVPDELLIQLKPGGVLVIPVDDTLTQIRKISEEDFQTQEFPGFIFDPLK